MQTGVKSFGCENSTAHESPIHPWKRILPSVVSASKSGAVSPSLMLTFVLLRWGLGSTPALQSTRSRSGCAAKLIGDSHGRLAGSAPMALSDGSPSPEDACLAGPAGWAWRWSSPVARTTSRRNSRRPTTTEPTTTAVTTSPDCVLTPELTEGPYYLDLDLMRRDITEGRPGLRPRPRRQGRGRGVVREPIEDAIVDVWHCDAEGVYSGVEATTARSCAASRWPTAPARPPSARSSPAGTRAAPSTST